MPLLLKAKIFNWTINRDTKLLLYLLHAIFTKDKSKHVRKERKVCWCSAKLKWVKQSVRACLRAAKLRRSGGSHHRKKYYLQLLSCVSPASNAVLSVVLSVMPIFRRPCFHEIKRHVIAPRVNSTADWTIREAEKLFTACKWPSERPSHHKTNHASSSLAVSMRRGGGQGGTFHLYTAINPHMGSCVKQVPKELHYVYDLVLIIKQGNWKRHLFEQLGLFALTARTEHIPSWASYGIVLIRMWVHRLYVQLYEKAVVN